MLWVYLIAMFAFDTGYQLLKLGLLPHAESYLPLAQQISRIGLLVSALLATREFLTSYWAPRISDAPARYNLTRLIGFFVGLTLFITVVSMTFADWTTGLVSLGILSVVLGFALKAPLTNLFAWFYILIRHSYRVGDRIRIDDATGDVTDVGYFDTTLWEFDGQYLSTDHPSGRIIKFPNSLVLNQTVYNYSWPLFPYIWMKSGFMWPTTVIWILWLKQCSKRQRRRLRRRWRHISTSTGHCLPRHQSTKLRSNRNRSCAPSPR